MLWVVLGWLESVKFIKTHSQLHHAPPSNSDNVKDSTPWYGQQFIGAFAHRARIFYELANRGWDTEFCSGGMIWSPYFSPYKNAITNELWIAASVGMYLYFPGDNNSSPFMVDDVEDLGWEPAVPHDPRHLKAAINGYDWLKNSNMTNSKGLYVDGFHISNWRENGTKCDIRNDMLYSYNQGVVLSGLRGLWESTGKNFYLEDGHQLIRNVMKATGWLLEQASPPDSLEWAGLGRKGILEEHCDAGASCDQNGQTFKGILFHHLTLFCGPLPREPLVPGTTYAADNELASLHRRRCQEYASWTDHNAKAALATRDEKGKFGTWWGARSDVVIAPLPDGAIDYRNNALELLYPWWMLSEGVRCSSFVDRDEVGHALDATSRIQLDYEFALQDHSSGRDHDQLRIASDLNDRGRGRTVEVGILMNRTPLLYYLAQVPAPYRLSHVHPSCTSLRPF